MQRRSHRRRQPMILRLRRPTILRRPIRARLRSTILRLLRRKTRVQCSIQVRLQIQARRRRPSRRCSSFWRRVLREPWSRAGASAAA